MKRQLPWDFDFTSSDYDLFQFYCLRLRDCELIIPLSKWFFRTSMNRKNDEIYRFRSLFFKIYRSRFCFWQIKSIKSQFYWTHWKDWKILDPIFEFESEAYFMSYWSYGTKNHKMYLEALKSHAVGVRYCLDCRKGLVSLI